jgi:hypothetical protein
MALTLTRRTAVERAEAALFGVCITALGFSGWHVLRFWRDLAWDTLDHQIKPFGQNSILAVICSLIVGAAVGCVVSLRSIPDRRPLSRVARAAYAALVLYASWRLYWWATWYFMMSRAN